MRIIKIIIIKYFFSCLQNTFLFTNSAQRELVSICTPRIRNRNELSLHYNLDFFVEYIIQQEQFKSKFSRGKWSSFKLSNEPCSSEEEF